MSFVYFTRLLVLLWKSSSEFEFWKSLLHRETLSLILRLLVHRETLSLILRCIKRLYLWSCENLILRPASIFLSCRRDKEDTDLCTLIIPRNQAWLRDLTRPERNKEGLSLFPNLSVLRPFRRTLTGQRSNPSFALQFSQFSRLEMGGDISPKIEQGH